MAKLDWKLSNIFKLLQRQVKDFNPLYNLIDICIAGQTAPVGPTINNCYYYIGDTTATVFGVAGVSPGSLMVYSSAFWNAVPLTLKKDLYPFAQDVTITPTSISLIDSLTQLSLTTGFDKTHDYALHSIVYKSVSNATGLTVYISDLTTDPTGNTVVFNYTVADFTIDINPATVYELMANSKTIRIRLSKYFIAGSSFSGIKLKLSQRCLNEFGDLSQAELTALKTADAALQTSDATINAIIADQLAPDFYTHGLQNKTLTNSAGGNIGAGIINMGFAQAFDGKLKSVGMKVKAAGDFYLVVMRKVGVQYTEVTPTGLPSGRILMTAIAGDVDTYKVFDLSSLNFDVKKDDSFGIYIKTGNIAFGTVAGRSYWSIAMTEGTFLSTQTTLGVLPVTPNNVYFDFDIYTASASISSRLKTIEAAGAPATIPQVTAAIKTVYNIYNGFTQVYVRKDGTGNFTDIQDAIDSILDASAVKQYEVIVCDDWLILDMAQLKGVATEMFIFKTKDFVSVRGYGSRKKIEVQMPNNIAADKILYVQPVKWQGWSRLENLEIIVKNGRYAVHTEGAGVDDAHRRQELINCILDHQGNQDAVNFAAWTSDCAWGFGNSVGQRVYAKNCKLIARVQPITYHSNIGYDFPTWLTLDNCRLIPRLKDDYVGTEIKSSITATEMGSGQRNVLELINCELQGLLGLAGSWYKNITNRDDAPGQLWHCYGHGNRPFAVGAISLPVLSFQKSTYGGDIQVTGGTAAPLIFGNVFKSRIGYTDLYALLAGSITIETTTNPYVSNYMATLGHRLGDCSAVNKTLIINIGGTIVTVTFNKNYSGGANKAVAPAYTHAQILAEINAAIAGLAVCFVGFPCDYPNFTDCVDTVTNSSQTVSIKAGKGIVYDLTAGMGYVKLAPTGSPIDGIALEDIPYSLTSNSFTNPQGRILLKGKMMINKDVEYNPGWYADVKGKMLKIGPTPGVFVETAILSEAVLIGISNRTWRFV